MKAAHFALLLLAAGARAQVQRVLTQQFPTSSPPALAYDESRRRLVTVSSDSVWEWDGQVWALQVARAPGSVTTFGYDPARARCFATCTIAGQNMLCDYDGRAFGVLAALPSSGLPLSIAADTA